MIDDIVYATVVAPAAVSSMRRVLSDEIFIAAPSVTELDTMNLTPSSLARARSCVAELSRKSIVHCLER